uniref:Uncharacterized protein n=1 Tax=Peronospora matthiolae TaxID=2874970 RepID=A0AAV1U3L3_9STRA
MTAVFLVDTSLCVPKTSKESTSFELSVTTKARKHSLMVLEIKTEELLIGSAFMTNDCCFIYVITHSLSENPASEQLQCLHDHNDVETTIPSLRSSVFSDVVK